MSERLASYWTQPSPCSSVGGFVYVIAAANLIFVPSLYFGPDAAQFHSAVGWGNSALAASLLLHWVLATAIVMLRRERVDELVAAGQH